MEEISTKKTIISKWLQLLLKMAVTIACLWYVSTKIDFEKALIAAKKSNWACLLAAFFIYNLSKLIGSKRLNIYFKNIGIHLTEWQNVKLYWLGMYYNLFLPGAITGDAYKVILLSKRFNTAYKKTTTAILLDRFSGLLSLGLILAVYSSFVIKEKWIVALLIVGAVVAIPLLYFVIKKLFPHFLPGFWSTFLLGAAVQITILFCIYFILFGLNISVDINGYVFIFLVAAIASVLPISVGGGLGVREFVIIQGAKYAGLDEHTALILSLLFYLITVICSLAGMIFVFKNPFPQNSVAAK
ncbi:MAG: flippase-like domain-containing protein [Chitinophagaceae bacterium]|nr:flippase-like domain-containing protein [Chitinophagaceae bacterium]